jgi:hypothetical protein
MCAHDNDTDISGKRYLGRVPSLQILSQVSNANVFPTEERHLGIILNLYISSCYYVRYEDFACTEFMLMFVPWHAYGLSHTWVPIGFLWEEATLSGV